MRVAVDGSRSDRCILYFHGGGYGVGTAALYRDFLWRVAEAARAHVLYFDFRLAPEHPFPAALEDAVSAYRWVRNRYDCKHVAFFGDSAGGGLVFAAMLKMRDDGLELPRAAVALSPLSLMPMAVAGTLLTLVSVVLTAVVLRLFLRYGAGAGSWWLVGWLLPVALLLEPVRNTLNYGQVNILLMALVAADCLLPVTRWPRGALVGLAAAVKLTPAAFVLFFLCRGDRRAAGTSAI